jgi:nitrogen fixation NifU-like protein
MIVKPERMDRQSQVDLILDHYENPRHYGALPGATVSRKGENPGCGDSITFYLQVGGEGRIADISFEGEGCTVSVAAASMVTELFEGKTVADVECTPPEAILSLVGPEIANARPKCATLGLDIVKEAARAVRRYPRDPDDV